MSELESLIYNIYDDEYPDKKIGNVNKKHVEYISDFNEELNDNNILISVYEDTEVIHVKPNNKTIGIKIHYGKNKIIYVNLEKEITYKAKIIR